MITLSFAVPAYNTAAYLDKCVESILACGDDIECIIVDDGSTKDDTAAKADAWAEREPGRVRVIHKENGGHGSAVNAGLAAARGLYFKVVDSDDWLDADAMAEVMAYLRSQVAGVEADPAFAPCDLVIANYVYEKVDEGVTQPMRYRNVFPRGREFGWGDIGHFLQSQYLLMHSCFYRTALLHDMGLKLPEHCFYVDNIFVYAPLAHVHTMRYVDADAYRYYIGREDQSVNEEVMYGRIDQHVRVVRIMIDEVPLPTGRGERKLDGYMENYLSMMMAIASVFLRLRGTEADQAKLTELWEYLRERNPEMYKPIRHSVINLGLNLPTEFGRRIGISGYKLARKLFKFN